MRNLNLSEMALVSGGLNCIDSEVYSNLHNQAKFAGILTGTAGGLVVGAIAFGLTMPVSVAGGAIAASAYIVPTLYAATAGALVFPWLAMYGYGQSSVWTPYFGQK